ncbi:MAG: peptidase T [Bacteroidia bacterium]|nr:peptidase T [Bacteroidia bacterium]
MSHFQHSAKERFLRYVQVDTQADPFSNTFPSTEKQFDLSRILVEELQAMGIEEVELDEYGYVYATIPSNVDKEVPTLCFCSHVDTSPDASGTGVKPIIHENYQGQDIALPDDSGIVISPKNFPYLRKQIGNDIITASGTTLLGADDKAGVTAIMNAVYLWMNSPVIPHGKIRILFTPDEEIGRGVNHVDMEKLGADFGFTLDGGERGTFEDQTFSADGVHLTIHGLSAHPGYAKGKMENALKIAGEVLAALPKERLSPEVTEGMQGFVHPVHVEGIGEKTVIQFIIRDFDTAKLKVHEDELEAIVKKVLNNYPGSTYEFVVKEQYRNMKEVVDQHPEIVQNIEAAIRRAGLDPVKGAIRGGTDGSRLSFMGLPCPNIFTGMQGIHSKYEWVALQDIEKASETIVYLAAEWAQS